MTPARANVVEAVLQACRNDPVLRRRRRVLVAVSGGPDSTALAHALARAAPSLKLDLAVGHVDHGLRRASTQDADKVATLAAGLGLEFGLHRVDLRGRRSEAAAREARYAALEGMARDAGADTIALGHTADDQAETVLLHLVRGSGLEGLAAMRVREGLRFRPLLGIWRAEVLAYCRRHRLKPSIDPSNADPGYTRNRVRAELIPLLEKRFNPAARRALVRLAEAARAEHDVVVAAASRWRRGRTAPFERAALRRLAPGILAEVLRQEWAVAQGGDGQMPGGAEVLAQALRLVRGAEDGMIQLGSGLVVMVRRGGVSIRHGTVTGPSKGG